MNIKIILLIIATTLTASCGKPSSSNRSGSPASVKLPTNTPSNPTAPTTPPPSAPLETAYVLGGAVAGWATNTIYSSTDFITWTQVGTLPRNLHYQSIVKNGNTYVMYNGTISPLTYNTKVYNSTDLLNWTEVGNLPSGAWLSAGVAHNNKVYSIGGQSQALGYSNRVLASSDNGATWSQISTLPQGLYGASVLSLNNNIYVIGGGNALVRDTVYRSTDDGLSWSLIGNLPEARRGSLGIIRSNNMYLFSGKNSMEGQTNTVYVSSDGITWNTEQPLTTGFYAAGIASYSQGVLLKNDDTLYDYNFNSTDLINDNLPVLEGAVFIIKE